MQHTAGGGGAGPADGGGDAGTAAGPAGGPAPAAEASPPVPPVPPVLLVRERVHCQRCGNVIGELCGPYFVERRGGRTVLTLASETIVVCEQCGRVWATVDRPAAGALVADLTRALGPLPVPLPPRLRGPHGDLSRNGLGEGKGC